MSGSQRTLIPDRQRGSPRIAQEQRRASEIPAIYGNAAKTPLQVDVPKDGDKNVPIKLVGNPNPA